MIAVASGHPGVDAFIKEAAPKHVRVYGSWAELREILSAADKVLLGQRLLDFPQALEAIAQQEPGPGGRELVLWVDSTFELAPELLPTLTSATIWRGEIDAEKLRGWWKSIDEPSLEIQMASRWSVVTLYPYRSIESLATSLTDWAIHRYGMGGVWVDCDGAQAALSLLWRPRGYERAEYPFAERRPHRIMRRHYLIPTAPPWYPGTLDSSLPVMEGLWRENWPWQAWFLGAQISRPEAVFAFSHMTDTVFWIDEETPIVVIERTLEFCRLYNPKLSIRVGGNLPQALTDTVMQKLGVRPLGEVAVVSKDRAPRHVAPFSRRKKE